MPDYKTGRLDDKGKDIYQDIAYPVTRQFRQELYDKIVKKYQLAVEQFAEDENDYYIYSTKQMVTRYKNLLGMLRQLKEDILAVTTGFGESENFSNTVFFKADELYQ